MWLRSKIITQLAATQTNLCGAVYDRLRIMGIAYVSDPILFALQSIQLLASTCVIQPDDIIIAGRDQKIVRSVK